jgi:tetratricopeptide (TPR) repeat protein
MKLLAQIQLGIKAELNQLPTSRVSIYARVNFAKSLLKMGKTSERPEILQILKMGIEQARILADQRAESYALGTLGAVYEKAGDWSNAKKNTQSALIIAQAINAPDMSYQWQWQMGRCLRRGTPQAENETKQAITYYTEAFKNISNLRSDLVALNPEVQFDFRESVEPVYR